MRIARLKQSTIRAIVRDRMAESGIDNYAFADGQLLIGSMRYAVEACGCGEPECDGLRLSPINRPLPMSLVLDRGRSGSPA